MSFSDMMSSGRGPGVIGMVMALVVLLGFGVLFMFAFDEGFQGGELSVEAAIAQQTKEIANYQGSIENGRKSLDLVPKRLSDAKELARLNRENLSLQENIATLNGGVSSGKEGVAAKVAAFEEYKDEYRAYVRGKAKGETMEELVTLTGVVYKKVNIREVTAVGIQIRHEEGQKRIPFEDLPDSMKDYYQFDPNQKDEALASESATRDAHEKAVAVADGLADQEMAKQREKDAILAKEKKKRDIAMKEAQISALQDEVRSLNSQMDRAAAEAAAARAAGRMHINKSSGINGNIKSKQNRITALRAEVTQMKASL